MSSASLSRHIVIVDDDEHVLVYLATLLSRFGYIIHEALTPERGFELVSEISVPVTVILDLKMQGNNGFVFTELVRNTDLESQPYILIHSVLDTEADMIRAYEAGADDYLIKGCDPKLILGKLRVAERAVHQKIELAERNEILEERTLSLERTLDLAGVLLIEDDIVNDTARLIFEHDIPPNIPIGLSALRERCIDDENRASLDELDEPFRTVVLKVRGLDGFQTRWIEQKTLKRFFDHTNETGRLSIARDVTEHYQLVADRESSLSRLQDLNSQLAHTQEYQKRMFAIIGHEMRTPLASMRMLADEQGLSLIEPHGKTLSRLLDHILEIMTNLRSLMNPEVLVNNTYESVSLSSIVNESVEGLRPLLNEESVELTVNPHPESEVTYRIQSHGLRRTLLNLIKNAALHSEGDHIWLSIAVSDQEEPESQVRIEVADNGKGIEPELVETLFEPFVRGNTTRDGTGLGLMICRSIIEGMNGHLRYEKRDGGGSVFVIELTLERSDASSLDSETEMQRNTPATNTQVNLKNVKVLIAEDNETLNILTTRLLESAGANVVSAKNGKEALELFDANPIDMVVTDLFMPELDGSELSKALRARGYSGLIIGLTAATLGEETNLLLENGASEVYEKPINRETLAKIVERYQTDNFEAH